ncbi:MAG: DoxX family protein [Deltaproteobacteria bacterium]|nr:DoxX family protein [Deltaproteobacteria bacterium]
MTDEGQHVVRPTARHQRARSRRQPSASWSAAPQDLIASRLDTKSSVAMSEQPIESAPPEAKPAEPSAWSIGRLVSFRFSFLYLGLFSLTHAVFPSLFPIPNIHIPDLATVTPVRLVTLWVAAHILHLPEAPSFEDTGSSDKTYDWVLIFTLVLVSALATAAWSIVDRRRPNHVTLDKWFRAVVRLGLAMQLFGYGIVKVFPMQMPFPHLARLVQPLGDFSPMGILWSSIGSAPAYERFAGSTELLAAFLLIIPLTETLGALVASAVMTQVFGLNLSYDVPVKIFSSHLLLLSVFLLVPDLPRLASLFLLNRPAAPFTSPALFATPRANRIATLVKVGLGLWLVSFHGYGSWRSWSQFQERSALFGIWDIDQLSIDGALRPPLATDRDRFRRALFDFPEYVMFQRYDGSTQWYGVDINLGAKKMVVSTIKSEDGWKADFTLDQPSTDHLVLDGPLEGKKVHMELTRVGPEKLELLSRGFHWVSEEPHNR